MVDRHAQPVTAESSQPVDAGSAPMVRRRLHPDQKLLLLAAAGVIVGSFLPWLSVASGLTIGGFAGAGLFTFYGGVFGLAGGLIPIRWLAIAQGLMMATIAVGLTTWQIIHLLTRVGVSGWLPGSGLIVVLASGLLALVACYRIRHNDPAAA